jgi:hypothetical protein
VLSNHQVVGSIPTTRREVATINIEPRLRKMTISPRLAVSIDVPGNGCEHGWLMQGVGFDAGSSPVHPLSLRRLFCALRPNADKDRTKLMRVLSSNGTKVR